MHTMWDQRYAASGYLYGTEPNQFFKQTLDTLKPGTILLPCEGEGRNAVYAASRQWAVKAFDFSTEGHNKALALAVSKKVSIDYQIAGAEDYIYGENCFDAVGLFYTHFPYPLRTVLFTKTIMSLKPGGILIAEVFDKSQLQNTSGGPKDIAWLFSTEELQQDLKPLKILSLTKEQITLNEGPGHQGRADVIRVVAVNSIK